MADSKSTINLSVPLVTSGKHAGGVFDRERGVTVYSGKVTVPDAVAEDLLRRESEHKAYEASLIRDNGSTGVHIDDIK